MDKAVLKNHWTDIVEPKDKKAPSKIRQESETCACGGTCACAASKRSAAQGKCKKCGKDTIINTYGAAAGLCDSCETGILERDFGNRDAARQCKNDGQPARERMFNEQNFGALCDACWAKVKPATKSAAQFGTVAWQEEMEAKIKAKRAKGEPLNESEESFEHMQGEHNKRLVDEQAKTSRQAAGLDPFVSAYLEAALWSSNDNSDPETGGEPLDQNFGIEDIAPESIEKAKADCAAFRQQAGDLLNEIDDEQAGHDFWLTRCGHGAGFWDRGLGDVGEKLSDIARAFGNCDAIVGDDGNVYLEGGMTAKAADGAECEYCAGYGKSRTGAGPLETCPYCKGTGKKTAPPIKGRYDTASLKRKALELWKPAENYMGDDYSDYYVVLTQNRDSEALEKTNFDAALKALGGEGNGVVVAKSGHWAVGWVEFLLVHKDAADKVAIAEGIERDMADYPVLDEEALTNAEQQEYRESFDVWGKDEALKWVKEDLAKELPAEKQEALEAYEPSERVLQLLWEAVESSFENNGEAFMDAKDLLKYAEDSGVHQAIKQELTPPENPAQMKMPFASKRKADRDAEIVKRDVEQEQAAIDEYRGQKEDASPALKEVLDHAISQEKEHRKEFEAKKVSRKAAALTDEQLAFLLDWARTEVNYSATLTEYAEGSGAEAVAMLKTLPAELTQGDGEALKTQVDWNAVENIGEIRTGWTLLTDTDMQSGHRVYMLVPPGGEVETAEMVLRVYANDWSKEDYQALTGEPLKEDEEPNTEFLYMSASDLATDFKLVFLDPYERNGGQFDSFGADFFKDQDNNVYVNPTEQRVGRRTRKSSMPENVSIKEALGGKFMVLVDGIQHGGERDKSGAGNKTFDSREEAMAYAKNISKEASRLAAKESFMKRFADEPRKPKHTFYRKVDLFTFDDLDEKAKDKVRYKYYEMADVDFWKENAESDLQEHGFVNPKVNYDLSSTQGSGVSFTAHMDVAKFLQAHPNERFNIFAKFYESLYIDLKSIDHHYSHKYTVKVEDNTPGSMDDLAAEAGMSTEEFEKLYVEFIQYIDEVRQELCSQLEKDGYAELEYQQSDEYIKEDAEANDLAFTESGEIEHLEEGDIPPTKQSSLKPLSKEAKVRLYSALGRRGAEEPIMPDEAYRMGYDEGFNIIITNKGEFQGYKDAQGNLDVEKIADEAFEAEQNGRQYTPFEFLASAFNKAENADELWEEYDRGVGEGISTGIAELQGKPPTQAARRKADAPLKENVDAPPCAVCRHPLKNHDNETRERRGQCDKCLDDEHHYIPVKHRKPPLEKKADDQAGPTGLVVKNEQTVPLMDYSQLTDEEKKELDYVENGEGDFFRYDGNIFDLGEFEVVEPNGDLAKLGFNGVKGAYASAGYAVKIDEVENDKVTVAWVYWKDTIASKRTASDLKDKSVAELEALIDNWMSRMNDVTDKGTQAYVAKRIKEAEAILQQKKSEKKASKRTAEAEVEEFDSEEMQEPAEDDIVIQTEGQLGGMYAAYQSGKKLAESPEWDELIAAVKAVDQGNFYPTIWFLDDHGGLQVVTSAQKCTLCHKADAEKGSRWCKDCKELADFEKELAEKHDRKAGIHKCPTCGKMNDIVNECGCDPDNMPTKVDASGWPPLEHNPKNQKDVKRLQDEDKKWRESPEKKESDEVRNSEEFKSWRKQKAAQRVSCPQCGKPVEMPEGWGEGDDPNEALCNECYSKLEARSAEEGEIGETCPICGNAIEAGDMIVDSKSEPGEVMPTSFAHANCVAMSEGDEWPGKPTAAMKVEAASNEQVIEMFAHDSFPKDKRDRWGTEHLTIQKYPGGWALVNYATPIVFRSNTGETFFNTQKYSVTTSKIQTQIRRYLSDATEGDEAGIKAAIQQAQDANAEEIGKAKAQPEEPMEMAASLDRFGGPEVSREQKIKQAIDMLSKDPDIIEMVKHIESKPATTKGHYGDYMGVLDQYKSQGKVMLHIISQALIGAGADAGGVQAALGIMTGSAFGSMEKKARGGISWKVLPNKNLEITATGDDLEEIRQDVEDQSDSRLLDYLEPMFGNGYMLVRPEQIGALTDSLIISDGSLDDNGEIDFGSKPKFWWYPQYELRSPLEDLAETGKTIFTYAGEEPFELKEASMEVESGLSDQVKSLRRKLKDLDVDKADPSEIASTVDALEKMEKRLKEQQEDRAKRKEEKAKEAEATPATAEVTAAKELKKAPYAVLKTAQEARDYAIGWQNWVSQQNLSYGELAEWGAYFEQLAERFPELKDEFVENGIIGGDTSVEKQAAVPGKITRKQKDEMAHLIQDAVYGYQINMMDISKVWKAGEEAYLRGGDVKAAVTALLDQIATKSDLPPAQAAQRAARYFDQFKSSDLVGSAWELDKESKKLRRKKLSMKLQSTADFFKNAGYRFAEGSHVWLVSGDKAEIIKRVASAISADKSYEVITLDSYGQRTGSQFTIAEKELEPTK